MNAVATKSRVRKAAAASISKAVPLVYVRPVHHYIASSADTPVAQRIETLRASLYEADEKIEQAYDAAERGSPVDLLLDHIGHELLADAVRPILQREEDLTDAKADAARSALFTVLAALEGAMALSLGTVLSANLAEAFNLLDWATDELEDLELHRLLPEAASAAVPITTSASKLGARDQLLDDASAHFGHAAAVIEVCCNDSQKCTLVWAADSLITHETAALDQALRTEDIDSLQDATVALQNIRAVLAAAAHACDAGDQKLVWAAHSLVELANSKVEQFVDRKVEE